MPRLSALIVDDDTDFRDSLGLLVEREGFEVRAAGDLRTARERLAESTPDAVLVDLGLPDGDGMDLLRDATPETDPEFIVVTGNASLESAVRAMRDGALDYLTKPLDRTRLKSILASVCRTRGFKAQLHALRDELRQLGRFGPLVGRTAPMQRVYDLIARVAPTEAGVLLTGERGTGKELVAETIHQLSRRREGPFLAVNCGAVAHSLIESELFGHERGSFTGAHGARRGYFEEANGGTLFLDEVIEMPVELQTKLLRVLETGSVLRVGASSNVTVNVRVIAATNKDPAQAVKDGMLREDLYYRLNVFPIPLPPLRDRMGDVELLADHFLAAVNAREGTAKQFSPEARARLLSYPWPGNVRELKNAVERAAILGDAMLEASALPAEDDVPEAVMGDTPFIRIKVGSSVEDAERRLILATLDHLGGDKRRAAEVLQISLKTLYSRIKLYEAAELGLSGSRAVVPFPGTARADNESGRRGEL
jgi:DNA-binding NtrC family response regulator